MRNQPDTLPDSVSLGGDEAAPLGVLLLGEVEPLAALAYFRRNDVSDFLRVCTRHWRAMS
jgi:hypothetical protein